MNSSKVWGNRDIFKKNWSHINLINLVNYLVRPIKFCLIVTYNIWYKKNPWTYLNLKPVLLLAEKRRLYDNEANNDDYNTDQQDYYTASQPFSTTTTSSTRTRSFGHDPLFATFQVNYTKKFLYVCKKLIVIIKPHFLVYSSEPQRIYLINSLMVKIHLNYSWMIHFWVTV